MRLFRSISHLSVRYWACSLIALVAIGQFFTQSFGFNPGKYMSFKVGAVYARAIIEGESGQPIYVVYDESGEEIRKIGEATGQYEGSSIMSGDTYLSYIEQLRTLNELYGQDSELELVSRDNYLIGPFQYSTGQTIQQRTQLRVDTKFVLIRPEEQRTIGMPEPLILAEFPVDLEANPSLAETVTSVIISKDGAILEQTGVGENIGFRTGFFGEDPQGEGDDLQRTFGRRGNQTIYGPVPGVPVYLSSVFPGGFGVTDEEGKYSFRFYMPPCPGFAFEHTTTVQAELYYLNFNPRGRDILTYYLWKNDWTWCIDYASAPGLPAGVAASIGAIEAQFATPAYNIDFPLEVAALTGYARLTNNIEGGGPGISFGGDTSFQVEPPDTALIPQTNYDFDGDGIDDHAELGNIVQETDANGETVEVWRNDTEELQGVYLSSIPREDGDLPHLTRLPDTNPEHRHQGLLEQISEEDLKDTDLYVFRKSNGQLVIERKGLDQDELPFDAQTGFDDALDALFYKLLIRGPGDYSRFGRIAPYTEWASTSILYDPNNEGLWTRESDNLRPGEELQIIMINRATGYIGTTTATMQSAGSNGFPGIGVYVDTINMRPPNLKIHARRTYKVKAGLTKDEDRESQIGFEGSALTDDEYIEIITEWYDYDGSPLPEELGDFGYTGRLARVVGPDTLGTGGSSLSEFSIRPGTHLEALKLPGVDLGTEHFYIHVNGERKDGGEPDFSSVGQNEGILQYRPNRYVPFLVQMPNEKLSIDAQNAYRLARQENPDLDLKKPGGIYQWFYRPEYQFSVFELKQQENDIQLRYEDENREIKTVDLLSIEQEQFNEILSSVSYLELLYSLTENDNAPLAPFGTPRELVFAFGEEEVDATVDENGSVIFNNFVHLTKLNPEDFLTMRLYQNSDAQNVLWEYAFMAVDIDVDSDNTTTISEYPLNANDDRSSKEEALEVASLYDEEGNERPFQERLGKLVFVNNGDADSDGIPDYADGMDIFETDGYRFNLEEGQEPTEETAESAEFAQMVVEVPNAVDPDRYRLMFRYNESDPALIQKTGNPETGLSFDIAPGDFRLWTKDHKEIRKIADLNEAEPGDYVRSNEHYTLEELGFVAGQNSITLYVESMVYSEDVADQNITVHLGYDENGDGNLDYASIATDTVKFTAIGTDIVEVDENNNTSPATATEMSRPSPEVVLTTNEISNLRATDDYEGIVGDLTLSGTLSSKVCDFVKLSEGGTIDEVLVFINSSEDPIAVIPTLISKGSDAGSLLKPYPFSGSFSDTISDVPLFEGNNVIRVEAQDEVYGFAGFAEFNVEVGTNYVGGTNEYDLLLMQDVSLPDVPTTGIRQLVVAQVEEDIYFRFFDSQLNAYTEYQVAASEVSDFKQKLDDASWNAPALSVGEKDDIIEDAVVQTGYIPDGLAAYINVEFTSDLDETTSDTITATFGYEDALIGDPIIGPLQLTETGSDTRVFVSADGSLAVDFFAVEQFDDNTVNTTSAYVTYSPDGSDSFYSFYFEQVDESSLSSLTFNDSVGELSVDYRGFSFFVNSSELIIQSDSGKFKPYMLQVNGPDELLATLQHISMDDGPRKVEKSDIDGKYYVKMKNSPAMVLLIIEAVTTLSNDGLTDAEKAEQLSKLFENYQDNVTAEFMFISGVAYGILDGGVDMVEGIYELLKLGARVGVNAVESIPDVLGAAWKIYPPRLAYLFVFERDQYELEMEQNKQILIGAAKIAQNIGEVLWQLHVNAADLIEALIAGDEDVLIALGARYGLVMSMGAELIEAAWEAVQDLPPDRQGYYVGRVIFEIGLILLPPIKAAQTTGHAGKLAKVSKVDFLTDMTNKLEQWEIFATAKGQAAIAKLRNKLRLMATTKMCFVAGTLIHTNQGLMPIEAIQPGMEVFSRDPETKVQAYRAVVDTIITYPETLYHITISSEKGSETLICTGEHPFYVISSDEFIPARELKLDARLYLFNGSEGYVQEILIEESADDELFTTYNFEVADFHTYFVGEQGVWVHNSAPGPCVRIFALFHRLMERYGNDTWRAFAVTRDKIRNVGTLIKGRNEIFNVKLLNEARVTYFDEFASGVTPPPWFNISIQTFRGIPGSPDRLKRNMEKVYGITKPKGMNSHHIVPKNQPNAADVLDILDEAGIHVDEAANGFWMKDTVMEKSFAKQGNQNWLDGLGFKHNSNHSDGYVDTVRERLEPYRGRGPSAANDIRNELQLIAKELSEGTFEWP